MNDEGNYHHVSTLRGSRMIDVARAAGVSRVTVSRVLSNTGVVTPQKRDAVLAAVKRLNYLRNYNAGALAGRRTLAVGVLVSELAKPWVALAVGKLSDVLYDMGYQLFIEQAHHDVSREDNVIERFLQRRVDAIVIVDSEGLAARVIQQYTTRIRVILSGESIEDFDAMKLASHVLALKS